MERHTSGGCSGNSQEFQLTVQPPMSDRSSVYLIRPDRCIWRWARFASLQSLIVASHSESNEHASAQLNELTANLNTDLTRRAEIGKVFTRLAGPLSGVWGTARGDATTTMRSRGRGQPGSLHCVSTSHEEVMC
jgi:hypothetical protein